VLEVRDLVVRYGSAVALDGVSLEVREGEMVALVGPNGAGKTTLVNAISGMVPVTAGSIRLEGSLAQVPEGRQLFPDLSVDDNLRLGGWSSGRRDPSPIYELFPKLRDLRRRQAWTLSGGEQQMVAVGRALMAEPRLLAVDELSLGLAPLVVEDLARHLVELNRSRRMAVLLIEQNARLALEICERGYVLEAGMVAISGSCDDLRRNQEVQRSYLGGAVA
jgi:branched-chain amino acid transport system ATP-binding protein